MTFPLCPGCQRRVFPPQQTLIDGNQRCWHTSCALTALANGFRTPFDVEQLADRCVSFDLESTDEIERHSVVLRAPFTFILHGIGLENGVALEHCFVGSANVFAGSITRDAAPVAEDLTMAAFGDIEGCSLMDAVSLSKDAEGPLADKLLTVGDSRGSLIRHFVRDLEVGSEERKQAIRYLDRCVVVGSQHVHEGLPITLQLRFDNNRTSGQRRVRVVGDRVDKHDIHRYNRQWLAVHPVTIVAAPNGVGEGRFVLYTSFRLEWLSTEIWHDWRLLSIATSDDEPLTDKKYPPVKLPSRSTRLPSFFADRGSEVVVKVQNLATSERTFQARLYGTAAWFETDCAATASENDLSPAELNQIAKDRW